MTPIELTLLSILAVASLTVVWSSFRTGITPMPSSRKACQLILEEVYVPDGVTVVDLGSGWGNLVINFAKKYRNHHVVGYELSLLPFLFSRLLKFALKLDNLELKRMDFMDLIFLLTSAAS